MAGLDVRRALAAVGVFVVSAAACSRPPFAPLAGMPPPDAGMPAPDAGPSHDAPPTISTGRPVDVTLPTSSTAAVTEALAADRPANADAFHTRWPAKYLTALPYDPLQATNLDLIANSHFGVSTSERELIGRNGFVISARQAFPTFFYGYKTIYADHLPLYVSLDSVLHAIHRSYDSALMSVEQSTLGPALGMMLSNMHAALAAGAGAELPAEVRADVDLYLTVARRLLKQTATPVAGGNALTINTLVAQAETAGGIMEVELFGKKRDVDFTQFKPRGHYAGDYYLEPYFRSMIWLGRTDLRFFEYDPFAPPGTPPTFHRRQFLGGALLAMLAQGADLDRWRVMDEILRGFVGESDNMTVTDYSKLQTNLGAATLAGLAALPDQTLAQGLIDGGFGIQRIASQVLVVPPGGANAPLDRVFLFFGQRFVIDSAVFSEVVFDRVLGSPKRMMPNPLDVAFSALGNNAAAPLLDAEMRKYPGYLGKLHDTRRLVDGHGADFWGGSLYTAWLYALRGFAAPSGDLTEIAGLPAVMKTEPWARRVLGSQLASWAELRHDTLLYAKQSYTSIPSCVFPDAYVDPYPDAWAGIVRLAQLGQTIATRLPATGNALNVALRNYFSELERAAVMLQGMAESQRAGTPFSAAQLAFINQTVEEVLESRGSGGAVPTPKGWYRKLFLDEDDVTKADPTIADVHSNPDPETQAVLHVATGSPRLMIVTADTCNGPRAYAGIVSSYHEVIPPGYQRLSDQEWAGQIARQPPADVPWTADLVGR